MTAGQTPLVAVTTTDLSAITRGRAVPERSLSKVAATGVGWVPANLSLTPFNSIVSPNPWGSVGDLRLVPALEARFQTCLTGSATPFDMVPGKLVHLDGSPWRGCTRTMLADALAELKAETGLSLVAAFEQEFQITEGQLGTAHSFSLEAMRRADPFTSRLMAALDEAGVQPEMVIAEFGERQFEVICAPADGLLAADRCVAIREITRETARHCGYRASFSPKTSPDGVGNGVHIHFSFVDGDGNPCTYDGSRPGRLSQAAGAFCAGVIRHMPAITVLSASSVPSYFRLKPHSWSSSYTWMGDADREASLRICPVVAFEGADPARQFNIEFRVADATANPYLALAAIIRCGLTGIRSGLPQPALFSGDPEMLSADERQRLGLFRLPETLDIALATLLDDSVASSWIDSDVLRTFVDIKRHEISLAADMSDDDICNTYKRIY